MKKFLSIILSILMVVTMIPMTAYAAADTGAYAPTRKEDYYGSGGADIIFANGTAITIEEAPNGARVWYMDGTTKKYVTNNGENGEDLSGWYIFVGSNNADGMRGVNGSITMTGGTVGYICAGQYYGYFTGTSNITITGGTVKNSIFCYNYIGEITSDTIGTLTIFDATGATIKTGDVKADNVVQKKGTTWNVSGNGIIPEGITVSVSEGETLTVPSGATLTNNGTLVNNGGTIKVYGKLLGKAPENYTAPTDFSFNTENLKANVSTTLQEAVCTTSNTTLLPWFTYEIVDKGTTEAVLSGMTLTPYNEGTVKIKVTMQDGYCEPISKTFDFPVSFTKVTSISGTVPTEAWVNMNVTLPTMAVTPEDASYKTVVWSVANANGTGATINGSTLKATKAGTATIRATIENGTAYGTDFTQDYSINFKSSEVVDISRDRVTIKKKDENTVTVSFAGFDGGSRDYGVDEPIFITGQRTETRDYIIDVYADCTIVFDNVRMECGQPLIVYNLGVTVDLMFQGTNELIGTGNRYSSITSYNKNTIIFSGDGILKTTKGIGGSNSIKMGTVIINSGTLNSNIGQIGGGGNVIITGGSISGTINGTATNGSENGSQTLSKATIKLNDVGDGVSVSDIDIPDYYSTNGVVTMDGGKIYLWLPADTVPTCITLADGTKYICNRNNTFYTEHNWTNATCFNPKHCSECGITDGDALEHNYKNGICLNCGIGEDGHFYISNVNHLMAFAAYVNLGHKNTNATLMADIDLAEYTWTPIGVTAMGEGVTNGYTGSFDGNGHVIRNVTIATPVSAMAAGVFGTVQYGGTVRNLGVENLSFDDNTYDHRAGGIAGQLLADSTISDCYVSNSTVKASSRVVGGIVGMNNGTVKNCYTYNMTLAGYNNRFGGISGDFSAGKLENCYTDYSALASSQAGTTTNCKAGVSADSFASGEIAYLLNGSTSEGNLAWGQLIGTDSYPVFGGETVYYNETNGYYNILHTCDFSGEWKYDSEKHWKECTVDGCSEISEEAEHSFTDGKCDCGYECPHEDTYNNLIRPVQNADGTWGKGKIVEICNICGNSSLVQEVERDHEGYRIFDETAAKIEAILNSGVMVENMNEYYTRVLNNMKNTAYEKVYTDYEGAVPSMTESLDRILAEMEAGLADGTMKKADWTYMTAALEEIKALIDNNPSNIIPSMVGNYYSPNGFYSGSVNNPSYSQAAYDEAEANFGFRDQLETLIAGLKDGSALKADYTEIDEAIAEIEQKLADENVTDEAKADLEEIKSQLEEMKQNPISSEADLAELEKALEDYETELDAGIEDGSAVKADYTAIDEAIVKLDEKLADENLTDEAKAGLEEIKADLEEMKNNPLSSKADLAELEKALEDYETELDAGIEDGTAIKVDGMAIVNEMQTAWTLKIENDGLKGILLEYIFNGKITEEATEKQGEIKAFADSLEGTVADNADNIKQLEEMVNGFLASFENCIYDRHNFSEYKVIEDAKCGANAVEEAACWFCYKEVTREVENSALTHSFTKYEVTEEAKCGVEGKKVATCDHGCGETDEKTIEALEHLFIDYIYNEDATCTADGTKTAECVYGCGETDTVTAEDTMLDHADEDGDKICDDCETEIKDVCPDCGGAVHDETGVSQYICMLVTLIKLLTSLIKAVYAVM